MIFWNSFLLAFSALLPLINPLGSALVLIGLVGPASSAAYKRLARRIAINTVIFLAVIELLGSALLRFFGISLPIVQVSGGLVIAAMGWRLLNETDADAAAHDKAEEISGQRAVEHEHELREKAFYPFTFPVTAGPGCLVVMLTLSAHAEHPEWKTDVLGHLGLFGAVLVLSLLVYVAYAYAPKITAAIPPSTAHGILRVVAFILLCIGVQIAWNGFAVLANTLHFSQAPMLPMRL